MRSQKDIKTQYFFRWLFSQHLAAVIVLIRINLNQLLVFRKKKRSLFSVKVQMKQCINRGKENRMGLA